MADFKSAIAAILLAGALVGAAEPPQGSEGRLADDDPRIDPSEIIAPPIDSVDPAWEPVYKSAEDPASIQCGGRQACEDYKAVEVAKSESQSSTQGAKP